MKSCAVQSVLPTSSFFVEFGMLPAVLKRSEML